MTNFAKDENGERGVELDTALDVVCGMEVEVQRQSTRQCLSSKNLLLLLTKL